MKDWLFVFIGGGFGSVVRFLIGRWVNTYHQQNFPWGTLIVNVTACFVLGVVVGMADNKQLISGPWRMFWTIGFCGGFSTFSTFSQETLTMVQGGALLSPILYISSSVLLCGTAVWGGILITSYLNP